MSIPSRMIRRLLATMGFLGSAAAVAWTPYGYGPYGPGYAPDTAARGFQTPVPAEQRADQGTGPSPGVPPYEYGARTPVPPDLGSGQATGPAPGYPPYGYGYPGAYPHPGRMPVGPEGDRSGMGNQPPTNAPYGSGPGFPEMDRYGYDGRPGPLQISRRVTDEGYVLDIGLGGMKPEEVQITAEGNWISIGRKESRQEVREDSFDQGRGYARTWSFSSGSNRRRLTLPRDADLEAMTREESTDSVRILIPRRRY